MSAPALPSKFTDRRLVDVYDAVNPIDATGGEIRWWGEILDWDGVLVRYVLHYVLADGAERVSSGALRFRAPEEIAGALAAHGFAVERVFGDYDRRPFDAASEEMIVVAARHD